MPKLLSAEAVSRYRRDGYFAPVRVLSLHESMTCRARLEVHERQSGGPLAGDYRHKAHLLFTWLDALVRDTRVLDAIEDVIGPDILCWSSTFFIKERSSKGFVSWHQDLTYWGLDPADVVTAWIAFTPSRRDSGAMQVIPGTHLREVVSHRDTFAADNLLTRGQEIAVEVNEAQAVTVELDPGEMSLHHVKIFHGSQPNTSSDRRIGFAIRYVPPTVRQIAGPRDSALLVRGEDRYGNFELESPPQADLDPAAVALHTRVTRQNARILYRGTDRKAF
jgi:non-haem Fe2+, alpha-ketoglutarate-dependent halogenase